ncbi:hypothetical protein ABXJ76_03800 [Methylobacter sp. G7]|uniref:hypothetical protein n=1 Tax=Methylobacter sp. G7 TaxID=3230117 RepID=UPI003D807884
MTMPDNLSSHAKKACKELLANEEVSSNPAVKKLLENKLLDRAPVLRKKGEVNLSALPARFIDKKDINR